MGFTTETTVFAGIFRVSGAAMATDEWLLTPVTAQFVLGKSAGQ